MLTADQLRRFDAVLARGLRSGTGQDPDNLVCAEQALALDEGLTDAPSCVDRADRVFTIGINDAAWSSAAARSAGLRPLILAQIGTAGTDRLPWVRALVASTIRRVVPVTLRAAASVHPDANHRTALEAAAIRCEHDGDSAAAHAAGTTAADAAAAAWWASPPLISPEWDAAERAAAAAKSAAAASRAAGVESVALPAAEAAEEAAAEAVDAARASQDAARAAILAAPKPKGKANEVLLLAVQVALDAYEATR